MGIRWSRRVPSPARESHLQAIDELRLNDTLCCCGLCRTTHYWLCAKEMCAGYCSILIMLSVVATMLAFGIVAVSGGPQEEWIRAHCEFFFFTSSGMVCTLVVCILMWVVWNGRTGYRVLHPLDDDDITDFPFSDLRSEPAALEANTRPTLPSWG